MMDAPQYGGRQFCGYCGVWILAPTREQAHHLIDFVFDESERQKPCPSKSHKFVMKKDGAVVVKCDKQTTTHFGVEKPSLLLWYF